MSDWRSLAACKGMETDLWYSQDYGNQAIALDVCRDCCVRRRCLDESFEEGWTGIYGIRGGETERSRKRIRAVRRREQSTLSA